MPMPVSVAMAVCNGERFVRQQIDSTLSQLGQDDELVISYDESVDRTLHIVQERSETDHRIKVISNPNPGIAGNFEHAIAACSNGIIFISDQDDIWLPGKRDRVVETFDKSNADLVIHNGYHVDSNGKRVSEDFFSLYGAGKGFARNFAKSRYSGCCMAFTKDSAAWILPFPRAVDCYDRWIVSICELHGKVELIDDVLLEHRMHDNNATPKSPRGLGAIALSRIHLARSLFRRWKKLR